MRAAGFLLLLLSTPLAAPVKGDGVQLQQLVLNLITNALDAVGARPPEERQVWVRTRQVGERVELVVEDSGMGLSISRSILEVHQGRLQAERRPGCGALFRCTLPLA